VLAREVLVDDLDAVLGGGFGDPLMLLSEYPRHAPDPHAARVPDRVEHSADRLVVDVTYAPGGSAPPTRYHERFEVRSGVLGVKLGEEKRELRAGDVLEIPRGTEHAMWKGRGG
jgi:quercetin dioxygenase-like cupin family protein